VVVGIAAEIDDLAELEAREFLPGDALAVLACIRLVQVNFAFRRVGRIEAAAVAVVEGTDDVPLAIKRGQAAGLEAGEDGFGTGGFLDVGWLRRRYGRNGG